MPSANLVRLVLLEARRGALPWLALTAVALSLGLAAFLSQVALTESRSLQAAIVAAVLRACAVFLVAAHVAASVLREINDKGLELMLSLPLARSAQYTGRFVGFALCGLLLAFFFALPLLFWASPMAVALWGVSLAFEVAVVAAATLFFAMSLAQLLPAIAASAAFYLLARTMASIQAIATGPHHDGSSADRVARWTVDAVALLFPRLDSVTRTEWLLYGTPATGAYAAALGGLAVYGVLLIAAGLFDFHRRSA
jgi:ABC-type Na+ efflux pump permease subunit